MEFKMTRGAYLFSIITISILNLASIGLILSAFIHPKVPLNSLYLSIPVTFSLFIFMVVIHRDFKKGFFKITQNEVIKRNTFINRRIPIKTIKGYKITDYYFYIYPSSNQHKRIKQDYFLEDVNWITDWLKNNFDDLNTIQKHEDEKELTKSLKFGRTEEERKKYLQKAKVCSYLINAITAVAFVGFFFKDYSQIMIVLCTIIPILSLVLVIVFKGMIQFVSEPKDPRPMILYASMFSSLLLYLIIADFGTYDNTKLYYYSLCVFVPIILVIISSSDIHFKKSTLGKDISLLFLASFTFITYSYSFTKSVNIILDNSPGNIFYAKVLDKRIIIDNKKNKKYQIKLAPWHIHQSTEPERISQDHYNSISPGDSLKIISKKGSLNIEWYEIVNNNN